MSYFVCLCGHSRDGNDGYYYVTASWGPYHIHTTYMYVKRAFPLTRCGVRVLCPEQYDLLENNHLIHGHRQKKTKNGSPLWVSSSRTVIVMFYGVVANQRRPQYTYTKCFTASVCQPRPTIVCSLYFKGAGGGDKGKNKPALNDNLNNGSPLETTSIISPR